MGKKFKLGDVVRHFEGQIGFVSSVSPLKIYIEQSYFKSNTHECGKEFKVSPDEITTTVYSRLPASRKLAQENPDVLSFNPRTYY